MKAVRRLQPPEVLQRGVSLWRCRLSSTLRLMLTENSSTSGWRNFCPEYFCFIAARYCDLSFIAGSCSVVLVRWSSSVHAATCFCCFSVSECDFSCNVSLFASWCPAAQWAEGKYLGLIFVVSPRALKCRAHRILLRFFFWAFERLLRWGPRFPL